jgi:hypothetical protein
MGRVAAGVPCGPSCSKSWTLSRATNAASTARVSVFAVHPAQASPAAINPASNQALLLPEGRLSGRPLRIAPWITTYDESKLNMSAPKQNCGRYSAW